MEEIAILIVEDDPMWSEALAASLHDFGYKVVAVANNFEDGVFALNNGGYDIVLLDIDLNGRNSGIELGRIVQHMHHKPFIYITGSLDSHTLQQVAATHPSAYLAKPVDSRSLILTIQSAINNFSSKLPASALVSEEDCNFFFVKQGNKYKKINWNDVEYLRSDRNYTCLYNAPDKTEYPVRSSLVRTLQYVIPQFVRERFVQVNRTTAVQLKYVSEVAVGEVRTTDRAFTVSDSYEKLLREKLKLPL